MSRDMAVAVMTTILLASGLPAQSRTSVLIARVADARTNTPIAQAEVLLADLEKSGRTNARGEARVTDIPAGLHRVLVRQPGYAASEITVDFETDTVVRVFLLRPATPVLDTVVVKDSSTSAAFRDFEIRRSMGIGHFLVDSLLRLEGTRDFALVAQSRLPGIRAISGGDGHYRIASTRSQCGYSSALGERDSARVGGSSGRGGGGTATKGPQMSGSCVSSTPCFLQVYLDGLKVNSDLDFVHTSELYGVEYYSGASAPAQYRMSGSGCGVLLAWTRRP